MVPYDVSYLYLDRKIRKLTDPYPVLFYPDRSTRTLSGQYNCLVDGSIALGTLRERQNPIAKFMDSQELTNLLTDLESDRVERKASISDTSKIRQALCAFANDLSASRIYC